MNRIEMLIDSLDTIEIKSLNPIGGDVDHAYYQYFVLLQENDHRAINIIESWKKDKTKSVILRLILGFNLIEKNGSFIIEKKDSKYFLLENAKFVYRKHNGDNYEYAFSCSNVKEVTREFKIKKLLKK